LLLAGLSQPLLAEKQPTYKVDPFWPQELPNNWIVGQIGGISVDSHNHIWVLQRPGSDTVDELGAAQKPPRSECCFAAPPVLEFDTSGKLLNSWGGPGKGYNWPGNEHAIYVDKNDNVWITGNADTDRQILKFSREGKFLMQIGHPSSDPPDSSRTDILGRPAGVEVDEKAHEVYVADGYMNKRVIVYDSETGAFKRLWGAYGNKPNDANPGPYVPGSPVAQQFRNPVHCVHMAKDGLLYVCDRTNDRIQVFTKQGQFVKEFFLQTNALGSGSAWGLTFSVDPAQKYLLVADGTDNVIWTLLRETGQVMGHTGHAGRNAGQFHWIHQIGSDSKGNLYTGEVDTGKRLQKFTLLK
jgi:hypothetical protein